MSPFKFFSYLDVKLLTGVFDVYSMATMDFRLVLAYILLTRFLFYFHLFWGHVDDRLDVYEFTLYIDCVQGLMVVIEIG